MPSPPAVVHGTWRPSGVAPSAPTSRPLRRAGSCGPESGETAQRGRATDGASDVSAGVPVIPWSSSAAAAAAAAAAELTRAPSPLSSPPPFPRHA